MDNSSAPHEMTGEDEGTAKEETKVQQARHRPDYHHVHKSAMSSFTGAGKMYDDDGVTPGVVGLRNLGNTCFINASLQCLSNTIPWTDYFLGYNYRKEINHDNFLGTGGELVTSYAELLTEMWLGETHKLNPRPFKGRLDNFAPQFAGYKQHDAQELLSYLLDGIHEDLNRVKERPYIEDRDCDGNNDEADAMTAWENYLRRNKSLVVDLFQGQLRNTMQCLKCKHRNIRFEPFMYLSLPISDTCHSLQDCLDLYLAEEVLTSENQWYCEKCKTHVDATKKTDLWILPPILIVHLKRFKYSEAGHLGSKNDEPIDYPIQGWDLSKSVCHKGGVYPLFDLYAVTNHVGGLKRGHYTAHALNRFDDKWYYFNDSQSHQVRSIGSELGNNSSAYVLFYNRIEDEHIPAAPGNDRKSPLIRIQSVTRPDLWPHVQVRDAEFREFRRSSRRLLVPPDREPERLKLVREDTEMSAMSTESSSAKKREWNGL